MYMIDISDIVVQSCCYMIGISYIGPGGVSLGLKVDQIGTKWDKSETFKDHFLYILARGARGAKMY